MTNQIDLIYTESDLFITFIAGDSTFSKSIYSDLVNQNNNSPKILSIHKKQVLNQLKKAGYIVKKAKKQKLELETIFKEMDELNIN